MEQFEVQFNGKVIEVWKRVLGRKMIRTENNT
jgi:hypothetical protein